jgi:hypothetical protein
MRTGIFDWLRTCPLTTAIALVACSTSTAWVQDEDQDSDAKKATETRRIRIVDRDGQELNPKIVIRGRGAVNEAGDKHSIQVTDQDGVITITDSDGKEHKINAKSVIVSSSQKTVVENGEEKTEVVKKAIVVDAADGKTYEIDLSKGDQAEAIERVMPPMVMRKSSIGKFMIGVAAQPVSEALAEQLQLEPDTGLVVEQISKDSPAEKAGLKVDDVLLFADQKPLAKVEDLVAAVQAAGEKKEALSLTLVRDDKEMSIELTPEERNMDLLFGGPDGAMAFNFRIDPEFKEALENMGDFNFDWAQAGPGIVIRPDDFDPEAIKAQIEMMQEQHRAHLDDMKKAFAERSKEMQLRGEALKQQAKALKQGEALEVHNQQAQSESAEQMRELLDEIKQLRQEIESLKKEQKKK